MSVTYEWDVELVATADTEHLAVGDIIDHAHQRSYAEAIAWIAANEVPDDCRYDVVLVRDDDDRRAWAYVEGQALPERFTDADGHDYRKVPVAFHREVRLQHQPPGSSRQSAGSPSRPTSR